MQCIPFDGGEKLNNTIVTIGKFDGIHQGHEKLFESLEENANGRQKVVLTFERDPKGFLDEDYYRTIVTEDEKRLMCSMRGIDVYMQMPMNKEFLSMTAEIFLKNILIDKLGASAIVCGSDFCFGDGAKGNVEFLKSKSKVYNYSLVVIKKEKYQGVDIASTRIRKKISEGMLDQVNDMLGYPYQIIGRVREGKKLGRTFGIPTANIVPDDSKLLPPNGVYKSVVNFDGREYRAVTNIGVCPTVDNLEKVCVESHIPGFDGNLYNDVIQVKLFDYIRPEKKFGSIDELKKQIEKDIEICATR